jgi:hypothetical protein
MCLPTLGSPDKQSVPTCNHSLPWLHTSCHRPPGGVMSHPTRVAHYPPFCLEFISHRLYWVIQRRSKQFLFLPKNVFWPPSRRGQSPKKWKFKVLAMICCGYSKLVSHDAWHNTKGIRSIWSLCPEKTSKTCRIIGIFWCWPQTAKWDHISGIFSGCGDWIYLLLAGGADLLPLNLANLLCDHDLIIQKKSAHIPPSSTPQDWMTHYTQHPYNSLPKLVCWSTAQA